MNLEEKKEEEKEREGERRERRGKKERKKGKEKEGEEDADTERGAWKKAVPYLPALRGHHHVVVGCPALGAVGSPRGISGPVRVTGTVADARHLHERALSTPARVITPSRCR